LFHSDEILDDDYTLMDVAYITAWNAVSSAAEMSVEDSEGYCEDVKYFCSSFDWCEAGNAAMYLL